MVLNHVAQRPGLVVVAAAMADADRLGDGDLHVVDVAPVPDRLEQGVGEAKGEQVLHRLLAQVVVDAVDLALGEEPGQGGIELPRRREVVAEGLLHHQPVAVAVVAQADRLQLAGDGGHQSRRDRQVEDAVSRLRLLLLKFFETRGEVPAAGIADKSPAR